MLCASRQCEHHTTNSSLNRANCRSVSMARVAISSPVTGHLPITFCGFAVDSHDRIIFTIFCAHLAQLLQGAPADSEAKRASSNQRCVSVLSPCNLLFMGGI